MLGLEDEITIHFLIAESMNYRYAAAFGFEKRKLKQSNVLPPREMIKIIEDSSPTNTFVLSMEAE